jgi:hypothetical protein
MSLTERKARPLVRDARSLRDDRLFIVACDDTYAPKQYFDFYRITRIQVHVVPTEDGKCAAEDVLRRLLHVEHEDDDERWMLLDTDHYTQGAHLRSFTSALAEAKRQGVNVALSKPCFELWLLLHHEEESKVVHLSNAGEVEIRLREKLGKYNKKNLRSDDYPLSAVTNACNRAEKLDALVSGGDIPQGNTSRVYQLWKAIGGKALPSQLPAELRSLTNAGNE